MNKLHFLEKMIWILLVFMLVCEFGLWGNKNVIDPKVVVRPSLTPFMSEKLSIIPVKGKGQGIVTTKEVKAGEVLIYDKPLFDSTMVKRQRAVQLVIDFILQLEDEVVRKLVDQLHSSLSSFRKSISTN